MNEQRLAEMEAFKAEVAGMSDEDLEAYRLELVADITSLMEQLSRKVDDDGRKLVGVDYWKWRQKAAFALRCKQEEIIVVKPEVARRKAARYSTARVADAVKAAVEPGDQRRLLKAIAHLAAALIEGHEDVRGELKGLLFESAYLPSEGVDHVTVAYRTLGRERVA